MINKFASLSIISLTSRNLIEASFIQLAENKPNHQHLHRWKTGKNKHTIFHQYPPKRSTYFCLFNSKKKKYDWFPQVYHKLVTNNIQRICQRKKSNNISSLIKTKLFLVLILCLFFAYRFVIGNLLKTLLPINQHTRNTISKGYKPRYTIIKHIKERFHSRLLLLWFLFLVCFRLQIRNTIFITCLKTRPQTSFSICFLVYHLIPNIHNLVFNMIISFCSLNLPKCVWVYECVWVSVRVRKCD